ncbi:thioredoxin family protein [soil metagenome]
MRNVALFTLLLAALPLATQAKSPVVVELYTAQGCASCGQANAYVGKLAEKPGVLALTFSVDYWDYLGWEDTFAKPAFGERQKAYVARLNLREPYTPQVVIDGRAQVGGLQDDKIDKLVSDAVHAGKRGPDMAFIGQRRVDVGSGVLPRGGAEVWLVRYDPREQDVAVRKGDNKGQTVPHRNVVVEIKRLGVWRGRPTAYRMPHPSAEGLATAVIVQGSHGGRVLAAAEKD